MLDKISTFNERKFRFSTTISIFHQNFEFSPTISIFNQNFDFLPKFRFSPKSLKFQFFNPKKKVKTFPKISRNYVNSTKNWPKIKEMTQKIRDHKHIFQLKSDIQNFLWPILSFFSIKLDNFLFKLKFFLLLLINFYFPGKIPHNGEIRKLLLTLFFYKGQKLCTKFDPLNDFSNDELHIILNRRNL